MANLFNAIFPHRAQSVYLRRKSSQLFQIVYYHGDIRDRSWNNYIKLKLPFFDPPTLHHQGSSRMITRPPLRYVTPDTDTHPLSIISFLKLKKKTKIRTHP